jgi:hypothetical protein
MTNLLAQTQQGLQVAPNDGFTGFGPLGTVTSKSGALLTFSGFISTAIGTMTIIAFIWFIFTFFTGVISIIGSGGDKQALETAKKKITTGLVGLVITIAAIFLIEVVGQIFGINILSFSALFNLISP